MPPILTFQGLPMAGTTAARPANAAIGQPYFDTSINQLLIFDGTLWRPASGGSINATVNAANSAQNNGTALSYGYTVVGAADGTKAVVLPAAVEGAVVEIKNNANNVLKVFPASGDAINAIAANTVYNMTNLTAQRFTAVDGTTWMTTPLAAS